MPTLTPLRMAAAAVALTVLTAPSTPAVSAPDRATDADHSEFYVPAPDRGALRQIARLRASGHKRDAALIRTMIKTPTAVWFDEGTAKQTRHDVRKTVKRAASKRAIPVLVAYNLPFRDCSQYSDGGAASVTEYKEWIDAFAAGIGRKKAIVILEPDGLGIIPWYTTINGDTEWCQPAEADPDTAAADRFEMLNHAVDSLEARPRTDVYLDGTHNGWLGVGDAADRLIKAGVTRAEGFFVNVSNYQRNRRLMKYGSWISQCVHLSEHSTIDPAECASQYYPASPDDFSTWHLSDEWYDQAFADTGLERDYDAMPQFVIDSSRNGRGPWTPPEGAYPDPQDWCNPPDRGLGLRPTSNTPHPLLDAYLWVKVPGQSDGECTRGLTDNGGVDPEWGRVDPGAGEWFPAQALELARLAVPRLRPHRH